MQPKNLLNAQNTEKSVSAIRVAEIFIYTSSEEADKAIKLPLRGWSLCEIMKQAGAGFHKPEQQQRLLFPVEAGQDDYIKEI